jgi:hypothetical protein
MRIFSNQRSLTIYYGVLRVMKMRLRSKVVIICLLSFLITASACKSLSLGGNGNGSSPSATGDKKGATAGPVSTSDQPNDVMMKAVRAQQGAKSYRTHLEVRVNGALQQSSNFEFVAPDRYHAKASVTGLETNVESITIGKDTWSKGSGGEWKKLKFDMSSALAAAQSAMKEDTMKGVDIRFVGPDTVDGTSTLVYTYTIDTTSRSDDDKKVKQNIKVWISTTDGTIRKTEVDMPDDKINQVATYTDYNSDIKIEPPL